VQLFGEGQKDLYVCGVHSPVAMRRVLPMVNCLVAGRRWPTFYLVAGRRWPTSASVD
jgi:hypothetical protein